MVPLFWKKSYIMLIVDWFNDHACNIITIYGILFVDDEKTTTGYLCRSIIQ